MNCYPSFLDLAALKERVEDLDPSYDNVIPGNSDSQDLDANSSMDFLDIVALKLLIERTDPGEILSKPAQLEKKEWPETDVAVGGT